MDQVTLAGKKISRLGEPFQGKWYIAEMDLWDRDAIDLVGPGFIEFKGGEGEMRFIAVRAWLDVRYSVHDNNPYAEFSWEGSDEGDPRCGRGWVMLETYGRTVGHIYFHMGDDSAFICQRR